MEEMLTFPSKYQSYSLFHDMVTQREAHTNILSPIYVLCGSLKKCLKQYQRSTETSTHAQSTQCAPPSAGTKNSCLKMREKGFCAKASLLLFELQLGTRTGP